MLSQTNSVFRIAFAVLCLSFSFASAQQGTFSTAGYAATWAVVDGILEVTMVARTTGWVGFGYKATPDSPGHVSTDMIVGRVVNGVPSVGDRWSTAFSTPAADTRNDVVLVEGYELNGETTIVFRKPVSANGDAQDVSLPNANVLVQWAFGADDIFFQHDGAARGSFIANLRAGEVFSPPTAAPTFAPTLAPTTTAAPTTVAPTTEAPTTAAPTTEAPTTAAPTTEAPTTAAPTTAAPTTVAPTTEAPTTAAPTTAAPTTAAPTTAAPTTAAPTTAAPTTAAPTTAAPTTAAPTTAAPTTSAPSNAPTLPPNIQLTSCAPTPRSSFTPPPDQPAPRRFVCLEDGDVQIYWQRVVENGKPALEFSLVYRTNGWVGIGFVPLGNRNHAGADLIIARFVGGNPVLSDMYSTSRDSIVVDSKQSVTLISGSRSIGRTRITFRRLLDTGDSNDFKITNQRLTLLWAYGRNDVVSKHREAGRAQVNLLA